MITIVQIFQIIESNNYDALLMIINCNQNFNFNVLNKNGISLLYTSIKYRAKECFDLLINVDNLKTLESSSYYINPIHIALEYYINGTNHINKYYLDKLLEHQVTITTIGLKKAMNNLELFNVLYLRVMDKLEEKDYNELVDCICNENKLNILEYLYKIINEETIIIINKILFKYSIRYDNICIINYLEKYNFDFTLINGKPSLYYILNYNTQVFDYVYKYYANKTADELNIIPNIYTYDFPYNLLINMINKYLLLKLDFHKIVTNLFINALNYTKKYDSENYNNLIIIIYIILKNKNINITIKDNIIFLNNNSNLLIKLLNIIEHFKLNITNNILDNINTLIINHKYNYVQNKTNFLHGLNKMYENLFP